MVCAKKKIKFCHQFPCELFLVVEAKNLPAEADVTINVPVYRVCCGKSDSFLSSVLIQVEPKFKIGFVFWLNFYSVFFSKTYL